VFVAHQEVDVVGKVEIELVAARHRVGKIETAQRRLLQPELERSTGLEYDADVARLQPAYAFRRIEQKFFAERERPRTAQSFCVPKADIAASSYDLSLNRYKEVVHEEVLHRAPKDILADLARLEAEIQQGLKELEGMLR